MLLGLFAGTGSGLMLINNVGFIAESLGKDGHTYVTIIGVCNCLGRD